MVARTCVLALLIAGGLTCGAAASERTTLAIRYQEGKTTEIHLDGTAASPRLRGRAKVEAERGAATIDVKFEDMQPASTFGPYHGTYVLWGITPEGQTNILGELVERERAESERVVAERAREEATAAQQQAEQARAAQQAAYEQAAAAMREAQKATAERDQLRQQLERSIGAILETTRTARGLIVNLGDVLFDTGQASLRPEAREKLSRLTGVLLAYPGAYTLEVEGHTDSTGSEELNDRLSKARAEAVRDYIGAGGIDAGRFVGTRGFGMTRPVASNDTSEGRQRNRRVEIVINDQTE